MPELQDSLATQEQLTQWTRQQVADLFELPFNDLVFQAASVHRTHHDANKVQLSSLLSIKTGACPEDCAYCPQSARYKTGLKKEKLLPLDKICLLYTSPSPRDATLSRMPSSA